MENDEIYLDSYVLQQDMRIRLPKQVLNNLNIEKGKSVLDIYINSKTRDIILKKSEKKIDLLENEK